ncbi:TetR family transcriptional regulator [Agrobacterium vitis]|uniref:TetR family transcriptional regulator n=1 Tax=Agrobacterium vitis TaxID=373 RepID=UPI0012E8B6A7|nr:TetR/AcrR family transcriptional regulator [Agrobacterium vitis]MUZ62600.1 TetR family transcriptional regulator [Agrobacterium vitis]
MADFASRPATRSLRRRPKQQRGRERVEIILAVALELIARDGVDAVTMKEIAALSGGPIASVYQYFPNKSAIIAALHSGYVSKMGTLIGEGGGNVSDIATPTQALALFGRNFDLYRQYIMENPHSLDLLNAVHADKTLAARDIAAARAQANFLCDRTKRLVRKDQWRDYSDTVFIFCHTAASTIRLSFMVSSAEREEIVAEFKSIARMRLESYFTGVHPRSP